MSTFKILKENKDFWEIETDVVLGGTCVKKLVKTANNELAMFKYNKYPMCTELASEKMCYEIAKALEFRCAKIDLAIDKNGIYGILNYIFISPNSSHTDASLYLRDDNFERKKTYTIENIKAFLDNYEIDLFSQFIEIMIFDALVGEQDRHEENWGITTIKSPILKYSISPLYDNSCNLLRDQINKLDNFENPEYLNNYIKRSKTAIYKDGKKINHFDLIKELIETNPEASITRIKKLENLTDNKISNIVNNIPEEYLTQKHKKYIIKYISKRRDILLNMIKVEVNKK